MFDLDLFRSAAEVYEGVNDTVLAQDAAEIVNAETIAESPVVQDYIDGPMTGNTAAKKLMAAAIAIANDKGYIPLPEKYSNPQSIATIADKAVETIKIAHDVATGAMSADDAIDFGIKKAAAVAKTAVDYLINKGIPLATEVITNALTSVFPAAATAKPFIRMGVQFVSTKVKPLIHKGIDKIAEVAKPVVKAAIETVKEVATYAWDKVKEKAKKIFG